MVENVESKLTVFVSRPLGVSGGRFFVRNIAIELVHLKCRDSVQLSVVEFEM